MPIRKSRKRKSRKRKSPCKYGRKKSMRQGCKKRPGPKRRSRSPRRRKSRRRSPRKYNYNMISDDELSNLRIYSALVKRGLPTRGTAAGDKGARKRELLKRLKEAHIRDSGVPAPPAGIARRMIEDEVASELISVESTPRVRIEMSQVDRYLTQHRLINPNVIEFLRDGSIVAYNTILCFSSYQLYSMRKLFDILKTQLEFHNLDDYYCVCPLYSSGLWECGRLPYIQLAVTGTYSSKDVIGKQSESIEKKWNPNVTNHREVFEELGLNILSTDYEETGMVSSRKGFPSQQKTSGASKRARKKSKNKRWYRYIVTDFDTQNQSFSRRGTDNRKFKVMSIVCNSYDKVVNDLRQLQLNDIITSSSNRLNNWRYLKEDDIIGVCAVKLSYILEILRL